MSFDGLPTRIEATYRITQDLVDAYAEVSGDRNPIPPMPPARGLAGPSRTA